MSIRERVLTWLTNNVANREPDLYIGGKEHPYLLRWYVIPRNPVFNVYFHKFLRSDHAEALHDHPWSFNASWLLDGTYREYTFTKPVDRKNRVAFYQRALPRRTVYPTGYPYREPIEIEPTPALEILRPLPPTKATPVNEGAFKFRFGKAPHRVELLKANEPSGRYQAEEAKEWTQHELPVKTLFITGPKIPGFAAWGFYCSKGWKRWQDFLSRYGADHTSVANKGCK